MKHVILTIFLFIFTLGCQATIITGEIEYNTETAREEVFSSPLTPISFEFIREHLFDADLEENLNAISLGVQELSDRRVVGFSDGSYGIVYYDDPLYSWYYKGGKLINFTKKSSEAYPCKTIKYKPDGTVANTGYKISKEESFIFTSDGKLIAHWKGKYCLDENDNIIMTRKNL